MPWKTQTQMNQRMEFVMRAQTTENFRALCREYGISPKVGYKWSRRFLQHGLEGLKEESRRPKSSPTGLSEEVVCRIVLFRERHPHWGAKKIHDLYRRSHGEPPSQSSIKRILEKCGLVKKRRTRPAVESGRLHSGTKAQAPNEIWTIDFKGWWHDANGRCDPLTIRDEFSRQVLELRALENAKTETVKAAMEEVFKRHGLPGRIRSDNGAPFASSCALLGLSRLSAWWLALGIDLERGRPGCPQDNGAHERMHLDISRQLEHAGYTERQAAFDLWRKEFNEERPHEALGMRFPSEVYRDSERKYEGTPEKLLYPGIESRRVKADGMMSFEGKVYFLSRALGGWDVGLAPVQVGRWEVRFGRLVLGHLEPAAEAFLPIVAQSQEVPKAA
jgi:putative transposase